MLFLSLAALLTAAQLSDAEVEKIHRGLLVIDTHNDVTSHTVKGFDIGSTGSKFHTDVERLRKGNVGAVFFAVYVAASYAKSGHAAHRALEMIGTVRHDIAGRHPGTFQLVTRADDVAAARKAGRIAALMGIEGGHAIEDDPRLLRTFYDLGVRYMTLTHSNNNNWADSSGEPPKHNGLTELGRKVVAEMNRLGMMVDVSHVSDKTFADVLEISPVPVLASHSSCRALANIPRNMSDDMIRALAKKGGVVQINFGCEFLNQKSADSSTFSNAALRRRAAELKKAGRTAELKDLRASIVPAQLSDIVAHIQHVRDIAGVAAVGIGSDFDGVECLPKGMEDVSKFPALTRALLEKGFTASDLAQIYGGNVLRVMREAERYAQRARN